VADWRDELLWRYCIIAECCPHRSWILLSRISPSVLANSELCFWSCIIQNFRAASALTRLVSSLQNGWTTSWIGSRHDAISWMTVNSPSVMADSYCCPRSMKAFCTGPHSCRNLLSMSTKLFYLVLQSSVRLTSLPSTRLTYGCRTSSFLVGECLKNVTIFHTLVTMLWYSGDISTSTS